MKASVRLILQALLASSHLLHEIQKNAANHGVMVDGAHIDIPKMMAQKDKAVTGLTKGVEGLFKKNKVCWSHERHLQAEPCLCAVVCRVLPHVHESDVSCGLIWPQVEYVKGWGKLKSADEVEVALLDGGSTTLKANNIIIATGSEVAPLPGIKIDEERCRLMCCRWPWPHSSACCSTIRLHCQI